MFFLDPRVKEILLHKCRGAAPLGSPVSGGGGRREDKPLSPRTPQPLSVRLFYLCDSVVNFFSSFSSLLELLEIDEAIQGKSMEKEVALSGGNHGCVRLVNEAK